MSFDPAAPSIPSDTAGGTVVAKINVSWSDDTNGSHPFTGTISFGQPYSNDGFTFTLQGNQLIVDPTGPGLSADAGTTQNVSIVATQ